MRIYKHDDPEENGAITLLNLISILNVPVTRSTINNVKSHNDYHSLASLSDLLREWNIESLGVQITSDQLFEIPLPAIAHLNIRGGMFIVLHECNSNGVTYIDSKKGWVSEPISVFEKKWTGVALLVSANENSGERDYAQKRKLEIARKIKSISLILLCGFLLTIPVIIAPNSLFTYSSLTLLLIKTTGLGLCMGLLFKQFGKSNFFVNKVCNAGKNLDCNDILSSPAAKMFGVISMSELGMIYFAGGVLSLLLASISKTTVFETLLLFNLVTLDLLPINRTDLK